MDALTVDIEAAPGTVGTGRVPPAGPAEADPDAPYGRKDDGSPKRSAGGRPRKSAGPRAPRARRYAALGEGLLHTGGALLGVINPVDGIILDAYAKPWGDALQTAAEQHPAVARLLDGIGGGSSLVNLAVMTATIGGLVAANHGALKGSPLEAMMHARLAELVAAKMPQPPAA